MPIFFALLIVQQKNTGFKKRILEQACKRRLKKHVRYFWMGDHKVHKNTRRINIAIIRKRGLYFLD